MSKPILSELEYNADNVASAILSAADLSVTNEDLGVSDRSSLIVATSGFDLYYVNAYSFNGFMFVSLYIKHEGAGVATETLANISDSDFYPSTDTVFPVVSKDGDLAQAVYFKDTGAIFVDNPIDEGDVGWWAMLNGFYRFA